MQPVEEASSTAADNLVQSMTAQKVVQLPAPADDKEAISEAILPAPAAMPVSGVVTSSSSNGGGGGGERWQTNATNLELLATATCLGAGAVETRGRSGGSGVGSGSGGGNEHQVSFGDSKAHCV